MYKGDALSHSEYSRGILSIIILRFLHFGRNDNNKKSSYKIVKAMNNLKTLPNFKNEAEEVKFWLAHDIADYYDKSH